MRSFEHGYLLETTISQDLLMTVRRLGECRGRQDLYARQSPEILKTLRQAAIIQSAESSNRIEGVTAEAGRVEAIVARRDRPRDRSEKEIAGYRDVLAEIHAKPDRFRLGPELLLRWHAKLFRLTGAPAGSWKAEDNAILEVRPDGRPVLRFKPVSALATPEFSARLCDSYREACRAGTAEPLLLVASFILDFECIHPFKDGNGRLGRLLTLLLLYQAGYEVGRYISLERIVEETKETYYEALHRSSQGWHRGRHDLRPWWDYFMGVLIGAYQEFETRVDKLGSVPGAKGGMVREVVDRLPEEFKIADIQRACPGVSYPTIKRTLRGLQREGSIRCLGKGRDARWERIGSVDH